MLSKTVLAILAALVLGGLPAMAETAADAPLTSAGAAALDAQIAAFTGASTDSAAPVKTAPTLAQPDAPPPPDRAVHGEVGAGIGTGGYREFHAVVVAPIGSTGSVAMALGQVRGRGLRGRTDLGLAAAVDEAGEGAPLRQAPGLTAACVTSGDTSAFTPLWISRMRATEPAAALDCPPVRAP